MWTLGEKSDNAWNEALENLFSSRFQNSGPLHLLGVGNPIRRDDSVGLFISSELIKKYGVRPNKEVRIHRTSSSPELLLPKLSMKKARVLIFDSIEHRSKPGSITLSSLADTRFGYFATHNIPLKLIPNLSDNMENLHVLGIEPETIEVGEGLSEVVCNSALEIMKIVNVLIEKYE